MKRCLLLFATTTLLLVAAGCSGSSGWFSGDSSSHGRNAARGMSEDPTGTTAGIKQLLRYDANKDGSVTRAEMEAGLKADFDALDVRHQGKLDADEVRAENERRFKEDGPQYSPLIDWNQDGYVDFNEFASTLRSLFDELDKNHDGVLTPDELKARHGPILEQQKKPGNHDESSN